MLLPWPVSPRGYAFCSAAGSTGDSRTAATDHRAAASIRTAAADVRATAATADFPTDIEAGPTAAGVCNNGTLPAAAAGNAASDDATASTAAAAVPTGVLRPAWAAPRYSTSPDLRSSSLAKTNRGIHHRSSRHLPIRALLFSLTQTTAHTPQQSASPDPYTSFLSGANTGTQAGAAPIFRSVPFASPWHKPRHIYDVLCSPAA